MSFTYNRVPVLVYSPTLTLIRQTFIGYAALEIFDHVGLFSATLVNDRTKIKINRNVFYLISPTDSRTKHVFILAI